MNERACPGCGLRMPASAAPPGDTYYNTSAECWSVFGEVLAREYENAVLFGQVHQLTVDAYAAQHAGGPHPDKSVGVHLCGLHLALVAGARPMTVAPVLRALADRVTSWPRFVPPPRPDDATTVLDAALASDAEAHVAAVRRWAAGVWESWRDWHHTIERLVAEHAPPAPPR
jgi:hypothetical protein